MTDNTRRERTHDWIAQLVLTLVPLVLWIMDISHDGMWLQGDSPRHALDGALYLHMMSGLRFLHPMKTALDFYRWYPAIAPTLYPPVFYVVEAILYGVFGISPLVPKTTVLVFAIVGVNAFYGLLRRRFPPWICFVSAWALLLAPFVLPFDLSVMLDAPAMWMSVVATWWLFKTLDQPTGWRLLAAPLLFALAFLTKQLAISSGAAAVVFLAFGPYRRLWRSRALWLGLCLGSLAIGGWTWLNFAYGGKVVRLTILSEYGFGYFLRHLDGLVSWPVLILAAFSLLGGLRRLWAQPLYRFSILWALLSYLSAALTHEEVRYLAQAVPPLVILSAYGLETLASLRIGRKRWVKLSFVGFLIAYHGYPAHTVKVKYVRGIEEVAHRVLEDQEHFGILYMGRYNGNFIFYVRTMDPSRRVFVQRDSKFVFIGKVLFKWGLKQRIHTRTEFVDKLKKFRIKYVVVETKDLFSIPASREERTWITGPEFKPVERYPIRVRGIADPGPVQIYLFKGFTPGPLVPPHPVFLTL